MADLPRSLTPAANVPVDQLGLPIDVQEPFEVLHRLALQVDPNCYMKQRNDGRVIYVSAIRRDAKTRKNLLTVDPMATAIRLRIMPEDGEWFSDERVADYRSRMIHLHEELTALGSR